MIDHKADHAHAVQNNWKRIFDCVSIYMLDTEHYRHQYDKHKYITLSHWYHTNHETNR